METFRSSTMAGGGMVHTWVSSSLKKLACIDLPRAYHHPTASDFLAAGRPSRVKNIFIIVPLSGPRGSGSSYRPPSVSALHSEASGRLCSSTGETLSSLSEYHWH